MTDERGNASVEGGPDRSQGGADVETEDTNVTSASGSVEADEGPGGERPLGPEATSERANALDETTAGDGVQMFEGDLGRDGDVERSG